MGGIVSGWLLMSNHISLKVIHFLYFFFLKKKKKIKTRIFRRKVGKCWGNGKSGIYYLAGKYDYGFCCSGVGENCFFFFVDGKLLIFYFFFSENSIKKINVLFGWSEVQKGCVLVFTYRPFVTQWKIISISFRFSPPTQKNSNKFSMFFPFSHLLYYSCCFFLINI